MELVVAVLALDGTGCERDEQPAVQHRPAPGCVRMRRRHELAGLRVEERLYGRSSGAGFAAGSHSTRRDNGVCELAVGT